uniref:Uncharacterized protein n=1 Tax=Rhizophora mucronata TaxID=61149 RepID=A0A2P2PT31_RHIMU
MNVWILLNNERIATFFTNCLQSLPFSNHIYLVARLVNNLPLLAHQNHDITRITFPNFTAAQNQHYCFEQGKVPNDPLCGIHC